MHFLLVTGMVVLTIRPLHTLTVSVVNLCPIQGEG